MDPPSVDRDCAALFHTKSIFANLSFIPPTVAELRNPISLAVPNIIFIDGVWNVCRFYHVDWSVPEVPKFSDGSNWVWIWFQGCSKWVPQGSVLGRYSFLIMQIACMTLVRKKCCFLPATLHFFYKTSTSKPYNVTERPNITGLKHAISQWMNQSAH